MDGNEELHAIFEGEMERPLRVPLPGGEAFVFSRKNPAAERANQDAALVLVDAAGRGLLAVADGMGGMPGGRRASRIAIEALIDEFRKAVAAGGPDDMRPLVLDAMERANADITALGIGAGTTLAVVELGDGRARPYHVGDSGILAVGQRGRVKLQNIPHSPTGYAVEAGYLDESEALIHGDRHVVSNIVGEHAMRIEVGSPIVLARRDTLLLASDGLTDNLTTAETIERIRKGPLERVAEGLAEVCRERMSSEDTGKPDDVTLILYRPRPLN